MQHDKSASKEKPDKNAPNSIQEHVKLQLHIISISNIKLKLLKPGLRHNIPKFRKLPSKYAILREFAVEIEHKL